MIKARFMKLSMTAIGFLFMAVATAGVNVASWTVIHNEPVPEEMK
ncbi:cyclic lactone autoinducer peptide [Paenibacillus sp. CFBP 13594]|nr:cyclic lactone autoinducer peptide [Paenibacillus sp. CFBP 13594]MBD8839408.1 cyclic lactone autoinducer peptide [Paenibacillus sp. CFBP 13594]